MKGRIIFW